MAVNAGCDIVLLCRSFSVQQEAISGLKIGLENDTISWDRVRKSLRRVLLMKSKCTSWEKALHPPGISFLTELQHTHRALSAKAYNESITLVRDSNHVLPLERNDDELLLLSPLVKPLPGSAPGTTFTDASSLDPSHPQPFKQTASIMSGEGVFRELGRSLARQRGGRVLHASYTANGVRPVHENLISRAGAIVILTADSNRNLYQNGFTKHVAMICKAQSAASLDRKEKPLIVVAVSSPYDFAMDPSIGTYICTYDFTETALSSLVKVLYGEVPACGTLPGTITQSQRTKISRQNWLVENWQKARDEKGLNYLIKAVSEGTPSHQRTQFSSSQSSSFLLDNPAIEETHFVVRNSSTQSLYGFCSTYFFRGTGAGVIGAVFVDPGRRKLSIGHSLHSRAINALLKKEGIRTIQLGSRLPNIFLGVPASDPMERKRLLDWFTSMGWNMKPSRPVCSMAIRNLGTWSLPEGLLRKLQTAAVDFDLVHGAQFADVILDHARSHSKPEVVELYRLALTDEKPCGIVRAKKRNDGTLLGTVVLFNGEPSLVDFEPSISRMNEPTGGILSPVISPTGDQNILLQGLILMGIRQFIAYGINSCVVDYVCIFFFL
jgi:beta-N-acetylhexosaminidase